MDLGKLSGTFTAKDYVGNLDSADYYKFELNQTRNFLANLKGISNPVSMYLYRDANENGIIDSGEQVTYRYGSSDSSISQILTAGSYFLTVENYNSTRYNLNLSIS
ncbi:MAG: hypothetical protein SAK29_12020 [Scytonema sp. PMC 1069.18]|nr:hypothetical protein [Scytonema sp. PMC 1069.18]MEC4884506.1 hypothetical protein [Scytonema sp. PMC 1070.18]